MANVMSDYESRPFTATLRNGRVVTHDVYTRGEGSPVVLIQELPGIGVETLRLADRLCEAGHKVVMPHLFGPLGRTTIAGNLFRVLCMRREFAIFARNQSSPVVDWLRALCRDVRDREGVRGVGVIGMCLTGNFAITLIGDDSVLAAVASQPALPGFAQGCLHMSSAEVEAARQGLDEAGPMYAFRFERDREVTAKKFDALDTAFNDGAEERIRLVVLPGKGHSVLTLDFVDEEGHPTHAALQSVLGYFSERLEPATA
jgi:dienelactone hydrolase